MLDPAKTLGILLRLASLVFRLYTASSVSNFSDSLINADYTALQLSIAGILLVLLALPHTPIIPIHLSTEPAHKLPPTYRSTTLHQAILFFRDSASPSLYAPRYAPSLFEYLQRFRQIFYLEFVSAFNILLDYGTAPPIPLHAVKANYDSFGAIPLPLLRDGYYFTEVGGRLLFALFMLHAVREGVRGRRLWEKETLAEQQALMEPPTSTATAAGASSASEPSSSPSSSSPAGKRDEGGVVAMAWNWLGMFAADPLAYTPDISAAFPYIMVAVGAMTVWDRMWPEIQD